MLRRPLDSIVMNNSILKAILIFTVLITVPAKAKEERLFTKISLDQLSQSTVLDIV